MSAARYAVPADLRQQGLPEATLAGFDEPAMQAALDARSATLDGSLRRRYTLPLLRWGADVTMIVVQQASFDLICTRGFNPTDAWDQGIAARATAADKLAERIASGSYLPDVEDSAPPPPADPNGSTYASSTRARRWNRCR